VPRINGAQLTHTHIHWKKKRAEGLKGHKPNRQISQQLNPGEIPYKNKQKAKAKQRVFYFGILSVVRWQHFN